jgi:hypothetical protein
MESGYIGPEQTNLAGPGYDAEGYPVTPPRVEHPAYRYEGETPAPTHEPEEAYTDNSVFDTGNPPLYG